MAATVFAPSQKPPTAGWDETMLEVVLSRAFMWLNIWDGSALRQPMRPEHYIHGGAPAAPPPQKSSEAAAILR